MAARLVGWVNESFSKNGKFLDGAALRAPLAAWLDQVDHEFVSRAAKVIPEARRRALERLRPITVRAEPLALRVWAVVSPRAEVSFEGVSYSRPPGAARPATILVYERHLEFVAGQHRASYERKSR